MQRESEAQAEGAQAPPTTAFNTQVGEQKGEGRGKLCVKG
jgi:hypothetical protein